MAVTSSPAVHKRKKGPKWYKVLVCGSGAGAVAKTCVAPLERVKMLCQTGETTGFVRTFKTVLENEGVVGLWRGNFANAIRIVPSKGVLFTCNDSFKEMLRRPDEAKLPAYKSALAGSMAGITASTSTYPLDLARTRLMGKLVKEGQQADKGIISWGVQTIKLEGFRGLYRGATPTLLGALPYEGVKFGSYDVFKKVLLPEGHAYNRQQVVMVHLACGALAGTTAGLATYPNDTVRRRLQVQGGVVNRVKYKGYVHAFKSIVQTEGPKGLYRGMVANLARILPNSAMQFGAFEFLKTMLQDD